MRFQIFYKYETKITFMGMCAFFVLPNSAKAEEHEIEIQLLEMMSSGININSPLDNEELMGGVPPSPNDFHAYISGRTLSVTSEATSDTQIRVVNRQTNQTVVNRQFSSFDSEQLPSGLYSIELQCGNLLLVGQFEAE